MEHIRKALEQAEKDRAEARSGGAATQPLATPDQPDSTGTMQTAPAAVDVRYHQTKVVDVPAQVLERHRLVAALPQNQNTDAYRMLRTRVLQQMKGNNWNALAITSPATGCGKTLTAINLAISLAREVDYTVLLVDLDLRSPSVHRYFEYEPVAGIADYIYGDTAIEDIMFSPGLERLVVLPGKETVRNSSETLRSPKMVNLVSELKSRYPDRLVICDLPPILATDDALAFSPYTDAMLMVAEAGETKRDDLQKSLDVLKDVPLVGTVLNKSEGSASEYYGYGHAK